MLKVDKKILIIISGILWTCVGIMLLKIAYNQLINFQNLYILIISVSGIIAGIIIAKFGFNNLAEKNINRIKLYKNKVCLFAFQNRQSYLLIIFMISLGIFIKSTSYIPKNLIAVMYISIGSGLFFASFRYYIRFYKCLKLKK